MTRKVLDLIKDALTELGALGEGVELEDEDAQRALRYVQLLHDKWQAERLMLFTVARTTHALAAGQQTRTIGTGGDFDIGEDRPQYIEHVGVIPVGQTYEVEVVPYMTRHEWLAESWKSQTDQYPTRYLYEPTYPLGTFTFWPIQTTAPTIAISRAVRLTNPATLQTDLAFPPGYYDAWQLVLARRLRRPWSVPPDPELDSDARAAEAFIRRLNDPGPPPAQFDICARGGYDIESNRYR
ncbi:MAG: hypothetical protein ACRD3C_18690 [Vicinamibacterales bacterium]